MSDFRVIKILNEKSIILNCGEANGIVLGDLFFIRSSNTEKIIDPFSHKVLGEIKKYKAQIEVVDLYDKMCICQNAKRTSSMADLAIGLSEAIVGRRFDLNVDPAQISGGFEELEDELIQIGDYVELIKRNKALTSPVNEKNVISLPAQSENPEGDQT